MRKLLFLAALWIICPRVHAQIETPVKWSYGVKKINSTEAVILIKATIQDGWHIYSTNLKDGGPIKTSITVSPSKEYMIVGNVSEPTPLTKYEKAFSMNVTYFEKSVVFQQKIKLKSAKASVIKGKLEYMTCNDKKCLPPEDLDFSVSIAK